MSEIDIRNGATDTVKALRFADCLSDTGAAQADRVVVDDDQVNIEESYNGDYIRIYSKAHAENLIKALKKSIELEFYRF